jgi:hypothetical protein
MSPFKTIPCYFCKGKKRGTPCKLCDGTRRRTVVNGTFQNAVASLPDTHADLENWLSATRWELLAALRLLADVLGPNAHDPPSIIPQRIREHIAWDVALRALKNAESPPL